MIDSTLGGSGIAVAAEPGDGPAYRRAMRLARKLGLPLLEDTALPRRGLVLLCGRERLEIRDSRQPRLGGIYADFSAPARGARGGRQPIARAIGRSVKTVVDATAGLGRDAWLLACMGYRVTAMERAPVIAMLLCDALARARGAPGSHTAIGRRLRVVQADARSAIATMEPKPDVIYMDPMFPPKRKKSALAKKEVRLIRQLVGDDEDAGELLSISRRHAGQRVVVKRPVYAPPLAAAPTVSYSGKLVRYDVYTAGSVAGGK